MIMSVLIPTKEIADLAGRARTDATARAVLADWLEEQGDRGYMVRYLNDRPALADFSEEVWLKERAWVIDAIVEAYDKRDALLALVASQRRGEDR